MNNLLKVLIIGFAGTNPALTYAVETIRLDGALEAGDEFGYSVQAGDFDCDGYDDLVVGVPGENHDVGAINIIYSEGDSSAQTDGRLHKSSNKQFFQNEFLSNTKRGDRFGEVLESGDFNGDGCDDLAVGIPKRDVKSSEQDSGAVVIAYGNRASGLQALNSILIHQDSGGVSSSAEENDQFGTALASGDFDNDGYDDLAVGVPGESGEKGLVHIFTGSKYGLSKREDQAITVNQLVSPNDPAHQPKQGDRFGYSLESGDFNNDGYSDLVAARTNHYSSPVSDNNLYGGAVHVMYGGPSNLKASGNDSYYGYLGEQLGERITVGRANGGSYPDLFVGRGDGRIQVILGLMNGTIEKEQHHLKWDYDLFGRTIAAGDFDLEGRGELAFSARNIRSNKRYLGIMTNMHDDNSESLMWLFEAINSCDLAGYEHMTVGDFNRDGHSDLALGLPYDSTSTSNCGSNKNQGTVVVYYGRPRSDQQSHYFFRDSYTQRFYQ